MADQSDVRRIALALPGAIEVVGRFGFGVRNKGKEKGFVWSWMERVDPKRPRVESHDVIAVRVADLEEKEMLLTANPESCFTEPHYNGYPAVLVRLATIELDELDALIVEAWRCLAPPDLIAERDRQRSPAT